MADDKIRALLSKQRAEFDQLSSSFVELESLRQTIQLSIDNADLDDEMLVQESRRLDACEKSRSDLQAIISLLNSAMVTTHMIRTAEKSEPCTVTAQGQAASSSGTRTGGKSHRVPKLPPFKGSQPGAIHDAFDFIDKCKAILRHTFFQGSDG
eukprot:IDg11407t1